MRASSWRYDPDTNILGKIICNISEDDAMMETSIEDFQKEIDAVKEILERYIEDPNVKVFSGLSYSS